MFVNANSFMIAKNKWENQQIRKQHNKIQYASKHYGKSNTITKRKHPIKQRKHRKKFKTQRRRGKIYKQMAFDYEDFICRNKHENCRRIQIRPTVINLKRDENIETLHDNYYNTQNKKDERSIDHIIVNIQFYSTPHYHMMLNFDIKTNEWSCPKCTLIQSLRYKYCSLCNSPNPQTIVSPKSIKQPIMQFAKTSIKLYDNFNIVHKHTKCESICNTQSFKKIRGVTSVQIAGEMLQTYKRNRKRNNISNKFADNWQITCRTSTHNQDVDLKPILYDSIPHLWMIYGILFEYIGYKSLNVLFIKAKLLPKIPDSKTNIVRENTHYYYPHYYYVGGYYNYNGYHHRKKIHKNSNNGMSYYSKSLYKRKKRYEDTIKDIKSYIPSYIYYKKNHNNEFYNHGEYTKNDWNMISYFRTSKRKHNRKQKSVMEAAQ